MGLNEREHKMKQRSWRIATALVVTLLVAFFGFRYYLERARTMTVEFLAADGTVRATYHLEKARTEAEQAKGLMFRRHIASDGGMIFIYDRDQPQSFWMKNTFISLDMIFVNNDKKIVGILPEVPILNDEPRKVDAPSRYVIELAAQSVSRHGIVVGDSVRFVGE